MSAINYKAVENFEERAERKFLNQYFHSRRPAIRCIKFYSLGLAPFPRHNLPPLQTPCASGAVWQKKT